LKVIVIIAVFSLKIDVDSSIPCIIVVM
jgi:hypothetical protein